MKRWIEILRAGTHRDSQGREHTFTEADLDRIATSYDPAKHEAPVVIGHPKADHPAWGWVEALKRVGDKLFYSEKDTVPEFNEMRERKLFKKRSVSVYPDGTLKHIGWLGAQPPAIKGLQDVGFSEADDCTTYEFSETKEPDMKPTVEELEAKLAAEKKARETAEKTANDFKEKLDSQTMEFAEGQATAKRKEIANFVEAGVKDGKILPAWKAMGLIDFMENLEGVATKEAVLEFAEGDKKDQVDAGQWFKKFISNFSEHPLFKEMTKPKGETAANTEFAEEDALGAEMAALVNSAK